ncbi:HET-E1 [Symbiodinium sp. KB8]|nr:HET-E1 [Symbiodinium sp. KB8]
MCQASKSHETQHDLDILRELGLTFTKSLVIMNYFNKQLPDMTRVSQVNSYVLGQRGKFPNARFVMLHHKDGIDKEHMSADELEDYIQQLPRKEQREFKMHLERMQKDEELTKEAHDLFGILRAINHVQGILLDWMRDNCRDVISSLRGDVMRYEHNVNELQQMIAASNPREIKDGWRNYTLAYENIISMMQYGRIASMKLPQPLFQLGPRDRWAETRTVVSTYKEEIAKVAVAKPPGWLETEALDEELKGSYTGHQLHLRLGPHAAFSRLVRVLGYMLFSMKLEPLTEEEMMTKSGHSRDGATHSFNKHTVILQLVTHGLLQMQEVVAVTLQQVKAIYVAVLEKAHKSLELFFPHIAHHRQFQKMLDDKYEELLMQKLTAGANAIHDRIVTKTRYFAVDLPNRILVLFGLTPMVQDVLVTNPASAYYNENQSDADGKSRRMPSRELKGVRKQREALLAMKGRLYDHQQRNPFSLIDFVEGGQQDLHQDEYRTINVDDINSIAHQYYMLVKGLLVLDIEGILDHDIFHPLENKEVLLRSMREEMLQAVSDLQDDEVSEMVGAGFQEMLQEQQDTNATLVKLKGVLAELETVASTEPGSDVPPLEWFLLLSEAVSADVLVKAAKAAKTDLVNLLRLPAHTVSTRSEPDMEHSFIRVTVRPASTWQGRENLEALIAEAEGKVSLGRVADVSHDGEAILSTSKSRCLTLHGNVSQRAMLANATHPAEGTIQGEGSQEDEAEAESETDANVEDEGLLILWEGGLRVSMSHACDWRGGGEEAQRLPEQPADFRPEQEKGELGEALVFEVTTKSPEARKGAVSPQQVVAAATASPPVAQPTAQPPPTAPVQPAPQPKPQPPTLPQTTEVPTEQGIMNHLPWLSEKRTSLLQLLAEWSQSHRVLDDLTDRLRRLGRDRPADQGPCELETGLRQVIAMVSVINTAMWRSCAGIWCRRARPNSRRLLCLQKSFEASKRLLDDHGWSRRVATSTDSACFLHKRPVRSVNFSSGGQLLCTSSEDGTARVYELETGRMVKEVDHGTTIWWSDFSCDGSMLCTASDDRSVRVYDCKTWKLLEMFGHGLPAKCASFSPDGQSVATASGDAFVRIFDLNEGDEVAKLKHDSWVVSVRYSPDGALLATGSADKCIRIFDVTAPEAKLVSKKKFSGLVTSVDFSPDSRLICASTTRKEDQTQIIEAVTGRCEMAIEQDALTVSTRFSPAGDRVCAVSGDHALVYDVESGEMIRCFEHGVHVNYAAMRADGLLCTAAMDGAVRFFTLGDGPTGRDLLQQFEFLELKTSTYENLRVAFHGAGEPAPVLPTPPSRPPEMFPPSPEKMVMLKDVEVGLSAVPVGRPAAPPVVPRLHLGAAKNGVDIDSAATNLSGTPSVHSSDESLCSPAAGTAPPLPKDITHAAGLLARSQSCVTLHERKACVEASPLTKQRILHQAVVAEEEEVADLPMTRWASRPAPNSSSPGVDPRSVAVQSMPVGRSASSPNPASPSKQDVVRSPQAQHTLVPPRHLGQQQLSDMAAFLKAVLGLLGPFALFGLLGCVTERTRDARIDERHAVHKWMQNASFSSFVLAQSETAKLHPGFWRRETWLGTVVSGSVKWPVSTWRANFHLLPSLVTSDEAVAMKQLLVDSPNDFDEDIDGVDKMVTYEFIISSAGARKAHDPVRESLRQRLRDITEPIIRDRIQPFVWKRYPNAGAVCHSMIRRYLLHERRTHDTHWDIPSYVSVVVSLDSSGRDFHGGFFVTTGNGEKSFIPLQQGDTVVHQSDLLHGVHVKAGERWSWAMWFQDSSDCSSQSADWWKKEAEGGDPVAQTLRAMRAATPEESWTWLQTAAISGFPRAQLYFGKAIEDGLQGKPNHEQASYWYEQSRQGGEIDSCYYLGLVERRRGNISGAMQLFRQGAIAGEPNAMGQLASGYQNGTGGLPRDLDLATDWFERAADFTKEAMYQSYLLYSDRTPKRSQDEAKARLHLERAARMGHEMAMKKFIEPLAREGNWEAVAPWLIRIESKAALSQFVKLHQRGVQINAFTLYRAEEVLRDLAEQGFDERRSPVPIDLLQSFRSYVLVFCELKGLREGLLFDETMTERAAALLLHVAMVMDIAATSPPPLAKGRAIYASAAALPQASPIQVVAQVPHAGHSSTQPSQRPSHTPAPARAMGVMRAVVSPLGRAMSTSALHGQVAFYPRPQIAGVPGAAVALVPCACAWK